MPIVTSVTSLDIKNANSHKNYEYNSFLIKILRPLSYFPSSVFVNLGFSATQVTLLNYIVVLVSLATLIFFDKNFLFISALLLILWQLLDIVDGNIARFLKQTSNLGGFLDHMLGIFLLISLYPIIGLKLILNNDLLNFLFLENNLIIFISCFTSILSLLFRLTGFYVHNIFKNSPIDDYKYDNLSSLKKNNFSQKIIFFLRNAEMLGGYQILFFLFFCIINFLDLFILIYFFINLGALLFIFYKLIRKEI